MKNDNNDRSVGIFFVEGHFLHILQDLCTMFIPICRLFRGEGGLKFFLGNTASELYVEVMTHKYYLSQTQDADVGTIYAMREYVCRLGDH